MRKWHLIVLAAGVICAQFLFWEFAKVRLTSGAKKSKEVIPKQITKINNIVQPLQNSQGAKTKPPCTIDGILYSQANPLVMIDKTTYVMGDSVCGGTITRIYREQVTVKFTDGETSFVIGDVIKHY